MVTVYPPTKTAVGSALFAITGHTTNWALDARRELHQLVLVGKANVDGVDVDAAASPLLQ